ncbi:MAG: WD40/YVTN/BNR-like repeat-containing protein, partial [bacterium]
AGTTAGLYRSVDNDARWKRLLGDVVVNTILVDPGDSQSITIGTDDAGILKSTDYGESFVPVNQGFTQRQVGAVAVQPGKHDVFYAGINLDRQFGGFFLSRDRGQTWVALNDGLGKAVAAINAILPLESSDEVFLGTSFGLFKGVPEKEEWSLVDENSELAVNDLDIDKKQNLLFLACRDGVYKFDLARKTLTKNELPSSDIEVTSVLVDEAQRMVFAGSERGVFRSRDSGDSWRNQSRGLTELSVKMLQKSGSRLLCGTKSGLFSSEDQGETWSLSKGVFPIEIVSIEVSPFSRNQVVAANALSGYFFTSRNAGIDWEVVDLGQSLPRVSSFAFESSGDLLAGTFTEGVLQIRSRSAGDQVVAAK